MKCVVVAVLLGVVLAGCASTEGFEVTVEVRYPPDLGVITNPRRTMSVSRGSTVEDATRKLIRRPWSHGLHEDRIEFFNRMLWRSATNDPRVQRQWAWCVNGVYPQTSAADWVLKSGDWVLWTYER